MSEEPVRVSTPLDDFAERRVDSELELFPEFHVYLGRPGREGQYADYSPDGRERVAEAQRRALNELRGLEPRDDIDRVTKTDLSRELELELAKHDAGFARRDLNVIASPAQGLREIFDLVPRASEHDWANIAVRLTKLPAAMSGYLETLREGIHRGDVPAIRQVREVAAQAERHASEDGFFFALAESGGAAGVPDALVADLKAGARQAARAYARLRSFLVDELAPSAPERDAVGRDVYSLASRSFLGSAVDLDETYEWGKDELARMIAEQEAVARRVVPGATVSEAMAHLDRDPTRKLHGVEALRRWMQETSDRAVEELSRSHFDIPEPVRRLECMIAPTQEGGIYYTGPSDDFSRAGRMWWSVPEGVVEFDTWRELTTVYHEGVPGHHLQIGQATYNKARLNTWRRFAGTAGHAEGWALYAERLMEELGYLDDPADRLGMLDGQRLRAARVVLDIGVHLEKPLPGASRAWRGDDAYDFLKQNVSMNDGFIRFEVNRYLGWPGQAPSYKIGQRIWEGLRDDAARREGSRFDIKAFHKRALDIGGVGLDTLRSALDPA